MTDQTPEKPEEDFPPEFKKNPDGSFSFGTEEYKEGLNEGAKRDEEEKTKVDAEEMRVALEELREMKKMMDTLPNHLEMMGKLLDTVKSASLISELEDAVALFEKLESKWE